MEASPGSAVLRARTSICLLFPARREISAPLARRSAPSCSQKNSKNGSYSRSLIDTQSRRPSEDFSSANAACSPFSRQTAYESVRKCFQELFQRNDVRPGVSIQTFGSFAANFHPHIHSLITEGVFTPEGEFLPLPEPPASILAKGRNSP